MNDAVEKALQACIDFMGANSIDTLFWPMIAVYLDTLVVDEQITPDEALAVAISVSKQYEAERALRMIGGHDEKN